MKRKFLSMLMALTMALTLIPTAAFAVEEDAATTEDDGIMATAGSTQTPNTTEEADPTYGVITAPDADVSGSFIGVAASTFQDLEITGGDKSTGKGSNGHYAYVYDIKSDLTYKASLGGFKTGGYFSAIEVTGIPQGSTATLNYGDPVSEKENIELNAATNELLVVTQLVSDDQMADKLKFDGTKVYLDGPTKTKTLYNVDLTAPAHTVTITTADGKVTNLLFVYNNATVDAVPVKVEGSAYTASVEALPGTSLSSSTPHITLKGPNGETLATKPNGASVYLVDEQGQETKVNDCSYSSSDAEISFAGNVDATGKTLLIKADAQKITSVTVDGFEAPAVNAVPVDKKTGTGANDPGVSTPTAGVTVGSVEWKDANGKTPTKFEQGGTYTATLKLVADDGYEFDSTSASLQNPVTVDTVAGFTPAIDTSKKVLTLTKTFDDLPKEVVISKVEITQADADGKLTVQAGSGAKTLNAVVDAAVDGSLDTTTYNKVDWSINEAGKQFVTLTPVDGTSATITPVAVGTAEVTATSKTDPAKSATVTITVTPALYTIGGTVTGTGPVQGATVTLYEEDGTTQVSGIPAVTTGSDGSFSIPKVPGGKYTIKVAGTGYEEYTEKVTLPTAAGDASLSITLQAQKHEVRLRAMLGTTEDLTKIQKLQNDSNATEEYEVTNGTVKVPDNTTYKIFDDKGDTGAKLKMTSGVASTTTPTVASVSGNLVTVQYYKVDYSVATYLSTDTGKTNNLKTASISATYGSTVDVITGQYVPKGQTVTFTAKDGGTGAGFDWEVATESTDTSGTSTATLMVSANAVVTCTASVTAAAAKHGVIVNPKLDNGLWPTSLARPTFYLMDGSNVPITGTGMDSLPDGAEYKIYAGTPEKGYDTGETVTVDSTTADSGAPVVNYYRVTFSLDAQSAPGTLTATYHGDTTTTSTKDVVAVLDNDTVEIKAACTEDGKTASYTWKEDSNAAAPGTDTHSVAVASAAKTIVCKITAETPLAGLTLDHPTLTLDKSDPAKQTGTLKVSPNPTDAKLPDTADAYEWDTSDPNVAIVTPGANGQTATVKAIGDGEADITVTATVGETTTPVATCKVTVGQGGTVEPGAITVTLDKTTLALKVGETGTVGATVKQGDDVLSGATVTWKSSDTKVATVENGTVKAVAKGTANITAVYTDEQGTATESATPCVVTVTEEGGDTPTPPTPVITGVTVTPATLSLTVGTKGTLTATVQKDGEDDATETVTWTSSDPDVATVADGTVTAKAAGIATITATSVTNTSKSASCEVTVSVKPVEPAVPTENLKGETKVEIPDALADHKTVLEDAAKSVETDDKVLGDNAETNAVVQGELAAMDTEVEAQKLTEILKTEVKPAEIKPVTITYLNITVESYNPDKDALSLRMNITPKVKVVLTTQKVIDEVKADSSKKITTEGEGQNAVELVREETLTVNDYIEVSVKLPQAFLTAADKKPIYARHYSHEYRCSEPGEDGAITFTTRGFSPFEFTTDPQSKVWINKDTPDEMGYETLNDALAYVKDGDVIRVLDDTDTGSTDRTDLAGATITILGSDGNRWTGTLTINGDRQTIGNDGKVTVSGSVTPPTPSHSGGSGSGSGGGTGVWGGTGSSSPRVSVNSGNHGKITASTATPKKGDIVTLTITPDDGYELDTLSVKSGGEELDVDIDGNKATFEMPGTSVTVKATFRTVGSEPGTGEEPSDDTALPFTDVADDFWAHDQIAWAYENGYMNGYSATTFGPSGNVTREQLWMVLARISGENPADMAAARDWAMTNNVSDGSNPKNSISRQQMVTMLYRYAQLNDYNTDGGTALDTYPDANVVQSYATDALSWAVGNGIVNGTNDGRLDPEGTAIRAQFAVILYRFCDTIVK